MATVVVLIGTSSAGKTTIARALQELAPSLLLNVSIDTILYALPPSVLERMKRGEPQQRELHFPDLVRAFTACIRALDFAGHDLVVDHAPMTAAEAFLIAEAVAGHRAVFVRIDCDLDELTRRETLRGDRRPGLAASQHERVHQWFDYDVVVDSSKVSAENAARMILATLYGATA